MDFRHTPVQNETGPQLTVFIKLHVRACLLLCCRVSPQRGQSSWLTIRPVCQQPWTVPLLPVFTQLPPSNPQGEPWPEGARGWPPHGKRDWGVPQQVTSLLLLLLLDIIDSYERGQNDAVLFVSLSYAAVCCLPRPHLSINTYFDHFKFHLQWHKKNVSL